MGSQRATAQQTRVSSQDATLNTVPPGAFLAVFRMRESMNGELRNNIGTGAAE